MYCDSGGLKSCCPISIILRHELAYLGGTPLCTNESCSNILIGGCFMYCKVKESNEISKYVIWAIGVVAHFHTTQWHNDWKQFSWNTKNGLHTFSRLKFNNAFTVNNYML